MFNPEANQFLEINGEEYFFINLPSLGEFVYCEVGRTSRVYKLKDFKGNFHALKVLYPQFRNERIVKTSNLLKQYSQLPGLSISSRFVITSTNHPKIIERYPELEYSILMPWISGSIYINMLINREPFNGNKIIALKLARLLADLESKNLAHCDLSPSNFIFNLENFDLELIGLDGLYEKSLPPPIYLPSGTPGYSHPSAKSEGQWCKEADRFSGALLISELLAWSFQNIRQLAYGETFFAPEEVGNYCERFTVLLKTIHGINSSLPNLLNRAWFSKTLSDCPPIKTWYETLRNIKIQKNMS